MPTNAPSDPFARDRLPPRDARPSSCSTTTPNIRRG